MNKNVLITGATGGIGEATVRNLLKKGHNVCMSSTKEENLSKLKERLKIEFPSQEIEYVKCNLSDEEETENLFNSAVTKLTKIDALVCNAGANNDGLAIRMSNEDFDKIININLRSSFILNRNALKFFMKQKSGSIVNITSVVAFSGNLGQANYISSKAALTGLTKALALEGAPRGITVNAIAPGFIKTAMTEKLNDKITEEAISKIPLKKYGEAEDIANAVSFLISEESKYITGQTIHVNGGIYLA